MIKNKMYNSELERSFKIPKKTFFQFFHDGVLKKISSEKIQQKWCLFGKALGKVTYSTRIRAIKGANSGVSYRYEHTMKYYLANDRRIEINSKITKQEYDMIFALHPQGEVVNKTRLLFRDENLKPDQYIADIFDNEKEVVIEIEFPNQDTMNNWVPPEWARPYVKGKDYDNN